MDSVYDSCSLIPAQFIFQGDGVGKIKHYYVA